MGKDKESHSSAGLGSSEDENRLLVEKSRESPDGSYPESHDSAQDINSAQDLLFTSQDLVQSIDSVSHININR